MAGFDGLTIREAARAFAARCAGAVGGEREAAAVARVAIESVTRLTPVEMAVRALEPLSRWEGERLDGILQRVLRGEPIQYVLGEAHWCGMRLRVTPDTLIPRPETQQLVDLIVRENPAPDLRVLDVGTGSGCIAIALARALRFAVVDAIDISPEALAVAADNASRLRARVRLELRDALRLPPADTPVYDLIVSNPPYIPLAERSSMERRVTAYEPSGALFVPDDDPLRHYRAVMRYAATALKPGGRLYFEINPPFTASLRELAGRELPGARVDFERDMYGRWRFLKIVREIERYEK